MNSQKWAAIVGGIIAVAVIGVITIPGGDLPRPMIDHVPAGWGLLGLTPYEEGLYMGEYDDQSGAIEYVNQNTYDVISIFYERAPKWDLTASDLERDADNIFQRDLQYLPDETGIMMVAGTWAGYARGYDLEFELYDLEIILVLDDVYLDVYAGYASPEAEDEIMDMINSISL
jgi:hypothetical protein